ALSRDVRQAASQQLSPSLRPVTLAGDGEEIHAVRRAVAQLITRDLERPTLQRFGFGLDSHIRNAEVHLQTLSAAWAVRHGGEMPTERPFAQAEQTGVALPRAQPRQDLYRPPRRRGKQHQ